MEEMRRTHTHTSHDTLSFSAFTLDFPGNRNNCLRRVLLEKLIIIIIGSICMRWLI